VLRETRGEKTCDSWVCVHGAEEGFEKLDRPINQGNKLSLFVKRLDPSSVPAATSDGPKWTIAQIKVGDWFDCKDSYEQWQVAKATAITASGIAVTYKGYSKYYDEVVPKSLSRLAEVRWLSQTLCALESS
jgi:hypothetical protein